MKTPWLIAQKVCARFPTFAAVPALLFFLGCATVAPEQPGSLPTATPFDQNPRTRMVYLDSYRDGYREGMRGNYEVRSFYNQIDQLPKELGWRAGNMEARQAREGTKKPAGSAR